MTLSSVSKAEVLPDSLFALISLEKFCLSEGVAKDCTALALAVVLILPALPPGPIKMPPLVTTAGTFCLPRIEDQYYKRLFECVDRCITLSCCDDGITSLLCSAFFEPRVPCNLVGAHLLGIRKAIESVKSEPWIITRLMVEQKPRISSLWPAAFWTGHASRCLDSALGAI